MLTVLLPWQRLPRFATLVPPLVYVLAASGFGPGHGDPLSSWAGMFLLPVFWISVYASGLEFAAGVVAVAIAILTPMGSAASRPDPVQALILISLAGALGIGSQRLFQEVRAIASGTWQEILSSSSSQRRGRASFATGTCWQGSVATISRCCSPAAISRPEGRGGADGQGRSSPVPGQAGGKESHRPGRDPSPAAPSSLTAVHSPGPDPRVMSDQSRGANTASHQRTGQRSPGPVDAEVIQAALQLLVNLRQKQVLCTAWMWCSDRA